MDKTQERVAVVVVHGIADQKPGETVRELARLLCHGAAGEPHFVQGEVREVLVPVARLEPGSACAEEVTLEEMPATKQNLPGSPSGFYLQHQRLDEECTEPVERQDLGVDLNDYLLSRLVLSDEDALYQGVRISLKHRASGRAVDLFEMYWADLSRLGQGGLAALVSLYRLFISLSTLASNVVDQAALGKKGLAWRTLQRTHAWSAWLLRGPSLLIQLAMLLLFLTGVFAVIPEENQTTVLQGLLWAMTIAFTGVTLFVEVRTARRTLAVVFGAIAIACASLAIFLPEPGRDFAFLYFGVVVLIQAAAGAWVVERYARAVHGVRMLGHVLMGLSAALFYYEAQRLLPTVTTMREWLLGSALSVGEIFFGLILLTWAFYVVVQVVALLLGLWLGRSESKPVACSLYTARLGLVSATALFAILSLVLWSVMAYVASYWLDEIFYEAQFFDAGPWTSGSIYLDARIRSLGGFFTPLVVLASGVGIAAAMVLAPALFEEIKPTTNIDESGPRPGATHWSQRLGGWLSRGGHAVGAVLKFLIPIGALAGSVLYLAFAVRQFGPLLGFDGSLLQSLNATLEYFRGEALVAAGKWLAGGALTVTALGSRFSNTFGRLRVALDAMTDVSNYFDDPPSGQSPRARIYSRYASLLKYLSAAGYGRIVIVSHSQGTVISADLLRYLNTQGRLQEFTGGIPLALVTVGSPLRDLYAERFPLLYQWMGDSPQHFDTARPRAADLGLREWLNACRSGDYVGRFIWTPLSQRENFAVAMVAEGGQATVRRAEDRSEFCLGAGGHTRYFSNDALVLGLEIERLAVGRIEGQWSPEETQATTVSLVL